MFLQDYSTRNIITGNYTLTTPALDCNNQTFNMVLDLDTISRPGNYVLVKADSISNYVGAIVQYDGFPDLNVRGTVRHQTVKFSNRSYDCLIVIVR